MKTNTAILIFAQSPTEELKRKAIHDGSTLFKSLNEHILETVKNTDLPYFFFTEEHQYGTGFGERFVNAVSEIYDKGFDCVITIGNDCPQLKSSHLKKTQEQLEKHKFVLGPATDGGFYLIGMHKSSFDSELFLQFSWQTDKLNQQILNYATLKDIPLIKLEVLFDIDNLSDLKKVINYCHQLPLSLKKLFIALLSGTLLKKQWSSISNSYHRIYLFTSPNKGSPKKYSLSV